MLHRVGVDLGTDEGLHGVEEILVHQRPEHGGSRPERRVGLHVPLGKTEIEILGVDLAAVLVDTGQALLERQFFVGGGDRTGGVQFVGEAVENTFVFPDDGVEDAGGVQESSDDEIPLVVEVVELLLGQRRHGMTFRVR